MKKVKVVFLDRDGVINKYPGDFKYVASMKDFKLLPGVKPALEKLIAAGFKLFIVSNQAGVSKGLYNRGVLEDINKVLIKKLGEKVEFSGIFYCIHRAEENCACRKPKTGLIDQIFADFNKRGMEIDRRNSYFVGDSIIDVETGQAAGLKTVLVFSGREKPENQLSWRRVPDYKTAGLAGAVKLITSL
ncbi:MAG: HAD family hydrolase [Candidatus Omnitrophota bacterium]